VLVESKVDTMPWRLCYHEYVCLFLAGLCKQHYVKKNSKLTFTKFSLKNGTQAMKKTIDFGGNPDSVTLGLQLRLGDSTTTLNMLPGICLTVSR